MDVLVYCSLYVVIILLNITYFKVANKYRIVDKPNQRSSHFVNTIRGGGVTIPTVAICYWFWSENLQIEFIVGLFLLSAVSFWDDISNISFKLRLFIQAVACLLMLMSYDPEMNWKLILLILPITIIFINGYNFMDGINGITGLYSMITLLSLFVINEFAPFVESEFLLVVIAPLVVFLYYNLRSKAICFAGDVGSVSIAFIISYLLILLVMKTGQVIFLGLKFTQPFNHQVIFSSNCLLSLYIKIKKRLKAFIT